MVFTTEIEIKLDWSEMDLFGHINNVAYFRYVQSARVNYLEQIGVNTANPENKKSFAVASSSCDFKKPLYFPETIKVITQVKSIGNTSMELEYQIRDQKGDLAAKAKDIIVLFDYSTQSKISVSQEIRNKIALS